MPKHLVLSVLFFQELGRPGVWVAQGLEHDIAAYGESIEQAKRAFERTVQGYFQLAAKYQQEPLASLQPAPDPFWSAWERVATKKTEALHSADPATPPAYVIQAITTEHIPTVQ